MSDTYDVRLLELEQVVVERAIDWFNEDDTDEYRGDSPAESALFDAVDALLRERGEQ